MEKNPVLIPSPITKKIVFHGPQDQKQVALTFDADMTPQMKLDLDSGSVVSYYDQALIQTLKDTETKATLFLSGMWIEAYWKEAANLATNPLFELANHSYSHPSFDGFCYGLKPSTDEENVEEIKNTQLLLKRITGLDNKLFRFPGGCYSEADLDIVKKAGATAIQWDAAGQDGFNQNRELIENNVIDSVKNGSIIVLHMNGAPNEIETANALPRIISVLRNKGFKFVTVSELLNTPKENTSNVKTLFSLKLN